MKRAYDVVLSVHIALGFLGLLSYWIPIFARKGRPLHVLAGRVFAVSMVLVSVSAFALAALVINDPIAIHPHRQAGQSIAFAEFLFFLGLLTFSTTWNGLRFVWCKRDLSKLRAPPDFLFNGLTFAGGIVLVVLGSLALDPIRIGFGSLGIGVGGGRLMFLLRKARTAAGRDYIIGHAGAMLGSGIALHTAFLAGGAAFRFFPGILRFGLLFSVLPTIVGFTARHFVLAHFRRAPPRPVAGPN